MFFFFQAEDGIRDLVRSRGLGDVYKRQSDGRPARDVAVRRPVHGPLALPEARDHAGARVLRLSLIHI